MHPSSKQVNSPSSYPSTSVVHIPSSKSGLMASATLASESPESTKGSTALISEVRYVCTVAFITRIK